MASAPDNSISQLSVGVLEECMRVVRVTNPALAAMGPITFHAGFRAMGDRFSDWLQGTFQQEILQQLLEATRLAGQDMGRELVELDGRILVNASSLLREGSGRAGRILLRQGVPAGVKCLQKLESAVETGKIPAHFSTVFGARCGIFSIGQRAAALAYVYQEMRLGAPDWTETRMRDNLEKVSEVIGCNFEKKMTLPTRQRAVLIERSHG